MAPRVNGLGEDLRTLLPFLTTAPNPHHLPRHECRQYSKQRGTGRRRGFSA